MKPLETTVREVLLDAIRDEMESRNLYRAIADRVRDATARAKLLELADKELVHRLKLEKTFLERLGEDPPPQTPQEIELPPDASDLDLKRVLKFALAHERKAEGNYRHFAERAQTTELRALFQELAEIEWNHKSQIEAEYHAMSDPEDFFENL